MSIDNMGRLHDVSYGVATPYCLLGGYPILSIDNMGKLHDVSYGVATPYCTQCFQILCVCIYVVLLPRINTTFSHMHRVYLSMHPHTNIQRRKQVLCTSLSKNFFLHICKSLLTFIHIFCHEHIRLIPHLRRFFQKYLDANTSRHKQVREILCICSYRNSLFRHVYISFHTHNRLFSHA